MSGHSSTDTLLHPSITWQPREAELPPILRYPANLAFGTGLAKLVFGLFSIVFAGMALLVDADFASVGGGFWSGAIATSAGILGLATGRLSRQCGVSLPVGFVCLSVLSLAASALLIVLAGTGLAHDSTEKWPDQRISPPRPNWIKDPAIAVNAVLLALATLDCLASILALAASLKLACTCWKDESSDFSKSNRLLQWLNAQHFLAPPIKEPTKPFKPLPHPVVYTLGPPPSSPILPSYLHSMSQPSHSHSGGSRTKSKPTPKAELINHYCPHFQWKDHRPESRLYHPNAREHKPHR